MKKGQVTKSNKTKKLKLEEYDETTEIEEEIEENDDEFDEVIEDDDYEEKPRKRLNIKLIINIVFIAIMIILSMITVDVIAVARYDAGPFFTIQTETYKDGGTKVYYGFGYKVINYNQIEGRKGKTIGFWNLEYSVEPTPISILDLAIEFQKDYEKTSKKFYNQYLKVTGNVKEIKEDKKQVILEYTDTDGKYTLQVIANITDEVIISSLQEKDEVEMYGIAKKFSAATNKKSNTIEFNNCFIKKVIE